MRTVHAGEALDKSRFNLFHFLLIFWGFFIILVDGYDVVIYGSIVPSLIEEWSISSVTAGAIGSYTVMGTVLGAVFFGYLADKVGRKKIILFCTALFSLFTALSGVAGGPVLFTIFRVISGIGLGGVMPNVIALTTEYAPKKIRSAMISFVFCGYSVGAIAAAMASRAILPEFGWRPIFWIAGLPLLILPFIAKAIPESAVFLLEKGKNEEVKQILKKVNPELSLNGETRLERTEAPEQGSTIVKLFEKKRGFSTIMFWLSCFSCFVLIYSMNTWLPKLMIQAGYSLSSSLLFVAMMNVGAIVGTIAFGPLTDKLGFKKVMIPLYVCGAIALACIGLTQNAVIAYILIGFIGASSVGVQNISNAMVSQYYPPSMRSSGVGASMAFGRLGGIFAPTFVGILLTMNLPAQVNFSLIAIAAVVGAIAIAFVQEKHAHYGRAQEGQPEEKRAV